MPYIDLDSKNRLSKNNLPENTGELNYLITSLCNDYVRRRTLNYATMNAVLGALEAAKLEFYRRAITPYEDIKIKENGDVYKAETTVLG